MRRRWRPYWEWESVAAGLYEMRPPDGLTTEDARTRYAAFLRDLPRFRAALERVLAEWPVACEHFLSNEQSNRIAWLGQAAMCIETAVPMHFRGGFMLLTNGERRLANATARDALNTWLRAHGEPAVR